MGQFQLQLEQYADQTPIVFTWYPNATQAQVSAGTATPQNLTGYTCTMSVRINLSDPSPVVTYNPALGGVAGTVTLALTASQVTALYALLPVGPNGAVGWFDIRLTSPGNVNTRFIDHSLIEISPGVS
jgi:hypothetical protein